MVGFALFRFSGFLSCFTFWDSCGLSCLLDFRCFGFTESLVCGFAGCWASEFLIVVFYTYGCVCWCFLGLGFLSVGVGAESILI